MKIERVVSAVLVLGLLGLVPERASAATIEATISWVDNSTNEDGFRVERKTGIGGTFAQVGAVGSNVISFVDGPLAVGTEYCWRVVAYNAVGETASAESCSTTPAPPETPGAVTVQVRVVP